MLSEKEEECAMIAQAGLDSEEGTVTFGPQNSDQDNFDQNIYEILLEMRKLR